MDRVLYLIRRERQLVTPIKPRYFTKVHNFSEKRAEELWAFRLLCVDRMYKMACTFHAVDSTAFEAVRLMDRCLTRADCVKISYAMMSTLAVACFDVAHKCLDNEFKLDINLLHHYAQNEMNERPISRETFNNLLCGSEVGMIQATAGELISPTPFDYVNETLPNWPEARNASLLISAMAYTPESTIYTAMEIAAAAVMLAKKIDTCLGPAITHVIQAIPAVHLEEIQFKMCETIDRLFSVNQDIGFNRFYADCKATWLAAKQK